MRSEPPPPPAVAPVVGDLGVPTLLAFAGALIGLIGCRCGYSCGRRSVTRKAPASRAQVQPDGASVGLVGAAPKRPLHSSEYRADVDGMRTVAVVAVIIYHMESTWLPGGFVGVDIFFVISGYVVTGSLLSKEQGVGGLLLGFYARRVKRLTPALAAMVLIVSVALSWVLPPRTRGMPSFYEAAQYALVGWSNVHFASIPRGGYFDDAGGGLALNPFTHTWSLGVEEQFYLLFPLLVAVRLHRAHAAPRCVRCTVRHSSGSTVCACVQVLFGSLTRSGCTVPLWMRP